VKHFVVSLEKTIQNAALKLKEIVSQLAHHIGAKNWIACYHSDTANPHVHFICRNQNSHGKSIRWDRKGYVEFQRMAWMTVPEIISARQVFESVSYPARIKRYVPLAQLDEDQLKLLVDHALKEGKARTRKNGSVISFEFEGRTIRLATLDKTREDLLSGKYNKQPKEDHVREQKRDSNVERNDRRSEGQSFDEGEDDIGIETRERDPEIRM